MRPIITLISTHRHTPKSNNRNRHDIPKMLELTDKEFKVAITTRLNVNTKYVHNK